MRRLGCSYPRSSKRPAIERRREATPPENLPAQVGQGLFVGGLANLEMFWGRDRNVVRATHRFSGMKLADRCRTTHYLMARITPLNPRSLLRIPHQGRLLGRVQPEQRSRSCPPPSLTPAGESRRSPPSTGPPSKHWGAVHRAPRAEAVSAPGPSRRAWFVTPLRGARRSRLSTIG